MKNKSIHFIILVLLTFFLIGCKTNPRLITNEGYVNIEGGSLWYRILGEGDKTPVLMLHGGPGGTCRSFYQLAELSVDRPIILFDQLGSGKSTRHEDTSLLHVERFVEQVKAIKTHLRLKEFYLHGHSWGTALALEYYSTYPEGVQAIIFNSPYFSTAIWEKDADTLIMTLPDSTQQAIKIGEQTQNFSSEAYQQANIVFAKNFGIRTERLTSPLDKRPSSGNTFIYNYMWGPTEFTATGTLKNYDNVSALKNISVPTLFITGEFDEARPPTVQYFHSLVPHAQFVEIEGAGHGTMHDNRDQNVKVIRDFLDVIEK
jgi:proline iminopeptidase